MEHRQTKVSNSQRNSNNVVLNNGLDDSEQFENNADLFGEISSSSPTVNQHGTGPGTSAMLEATESDAEDADVDVGTGFNDAEGARLDAAFLDDNSDDEDGFDDEDLGDNVTEVTTAVATADEMDVDEEINTPGPSSEMDIDEGIKTPEPPSDSCTAAIPLQAGCAWTRKDWSCAYDVVFMVFFIIYWQSPTSWRDDWRRQSPEWTVRLADRFDLLLGALDSPSQSPKKLSQLFSSLRDQFRDQVSSHDPQRFPRRGTIPISISAILELLFGSVHGPAIKQHVFCTDCGMPSQISRGFPLLALPVFPTDYRRNTDPRFVPAATLMTRFVESLATSSSSLCRTCCKPTQVQSLSMADSPWIWFEIEGGHTMSPSLTIPIELSGQPLVYDLHSVIYIGGTHFTARMRDPSNEWWNYDGMWKFGTSKHDHIQITEDLLYNGRRRAAFLIYRRSGY